MNRSACPVKPAAPGEACRERLSGPLLRFFLATRPACRTISAAVTLAFA